MSLSYKPKGQFMDLQGQREPPGDWLLRASAEEGSGEGPRVRPEFAAPGTCACREVTHSLCTHPASVKQNRSRAAGGDQT